MRALKSRRSASRLFGLRSLSPAVAVWGRRDTPTVGQQQHSSSNSYVSLRWECHRPHWHTATPNQSLPSIPRP